MSRRLEIAFQGSEDGVFTLNSALDGPDVLTDEGTGEFGGAFVDYYGDADGAVRVTLGTDRLVGSAIAGSMTVTVSRVDDPGFWNPNNLASSLNSIWPGFVPGRPGRLIETTADGTEYKVFTGFLRRATWKAQSRSCELYFEDLLFRAQRVFPVIASTGPTTTGAAIGLVLDAIGWTFADLRSLDEGDQLDDFSADGSLSALDLFNQLVETELGVVFVRGDGVFVYEQRSRALERASSGTLSTATNLEDLESGEDADSILTRVTVTKTDPAGGDGTTWTSIDTGAEHEFGRADAPAISSPYVPAAAGQSLADDIVIRGVNGKPPVTAYAMDVTDADLQLILSSPLQTVFTINDPLGDTDAGDYVVQGAEHEIATGYHRVTYTLTRRAGPHVYTLDSELDGPDVFRY